MRQLLGDISSGATPKVDEDYYTDSSGVPFLRVQNVTDQGIDLRDIKFIKREVHEGMLKRSQLRKDDLVFTITGRIGSVAVVPAHFEGNINQHSVRFHLKPQIAANPLNPRYVAVFLNSSLGQSLAIREVTGGTRPGLDYKALYSLKIILPPPNIQNHIVTIMQSAYAQKSRKAQEADALLESIDGYVLAELGIEMPTVEEKRCYVVQAGQLVGRIDPEYNHPKYEAIEEAIRRQPYGYTRIRDQFKENKSTFKIDPEKLYRYVEIGSVNVSTGDITAKEILGADLPANAKRVLKKGNIIISKVRTYRGAITIVPEDGYVGSGAFCVLQENGRVHKETLLSYLRSELFLTWALKPSAGTTYPTLNDNDILDFPIPIPPFNVQENIAHEVMSRKSEAARLKQEADAVVEAAKAQVERILLQEGSA